MKTGSCEETLPRIARKSTQASVLPAPGKGSTMALPPQAGGRPSSYLRKG
jgi:hypothetical protein